MVCSRGSPIPVIRLSRFVTKVLEYLVRASERERVIGVKHGSQLGEHKQAVRDGSFTSHKLKMKHDTYGGSKYAFSYTPEVNIEYERNGGCGMGLTIDNREYKSCSGYPSWL